jgi:hypothetical protein
VTRKFFLKTRAFCNSTCYASPMNLFDDMARDDRFGGFGYIGARQNLRDSVATSEWPADMLDVLAEADAVVLDTGVTGEALFVWANSKDGRWFADCYFGSTDHRHADKYLPTKRA